MLVVNGFFEDERFVSEKPVLLPQGKRVTVTIEEERTTVDTVNHSAYGRLKAYANPSLIPQEEGAWEKAAAEKYALS